MKLFKFMFLSSLSVGSVAAHLHNNSAPGHNIDIDEALNSLSESENVGQQYQVPPIHRELDNSPEWAWHNVALQKQAHQTSTYSSGAEASKAVDGNTNGNYHDGSVTHTNWHDNAAWEVHLENGYHIRRIDIYNREDCCASRLRNFKVTVTDDQGGDNRRALQTETIVAPGTEDGIYNIHFNEPIQGNRVRIELQDHNPLSLAEVVVSGRLAWKWTNEFSEENDGEGDCALLNGNDAFGQYASATIVTGWRCRGDECDDNALRCSVPYDVYDIAGEPAGFGRWGEVNRFSERSIFESGITNGDDRQCSGGSFTYRFECYDNWCGRLDMHCSDADFQIGAFARINRGANDCRWESKKLSEEGFFERKSSGDTGSLTFKDPRGGYSEWAAPPGRAVAGLGCEGLRATLRMFFIGRPVCDNKSFYTCVYDYETLYD